MMMWLTGDAAGGSRGDGLRVDGVGAGVWDEVSTRRCYW
jgi:hypothetical protein